MPTSHPINSGNHRSLVLAATLSGFLGAGAGCLSSERVLATTTGTALTGAVYYVRADGTAAFDSTTGCDAAAAAMSPAVHNRSSFAPGDTVYLCPNGGVFAAADYSAGAYNAVIRITSSGSADGGYITYDGQPDGDFDPFAANAQDDSQTALIDANYSASYGIFGRSVDYVIVQDVRIKRVGKGLYFEGYGNPNDPVEHVTVRRFHISDCRSGMEFGMISTPQGYGNGVKYGTIQDFVLYNIGENECTSSPSAINVHGCEDIVIQRGHIYSDYALCDINQDGIDGIVVLQSNKMLIERLAMRGFGEDCLDYKENSDNLIFRYNTCTGTNQAGIQVQHCSPREINSLETCSDNIYIYGNRIEGATAHIAWYGILAQRGVKDVFIWSNLIYNADGANIAVYSQNSFPPERIHIYNNTLANSGISALGEVSSDPKHAGIRLLDGITHDIQNNILYQNNASGDHRTQLHVLAGAAATAQEDYSLFYYSGTHAPKVFWSETTYTLNSPEVSNTPYYDSAGQGAHSLVGNPNFVNAAAYDWRLTAASALAIDRGKSLVEPSTWDPPTIQGVNYSATVSLSLAIDPNNSDFDAVPPRVTMLDQDAHGAAWELGAYVYPVPGDDGPAAPTGLRVQ